MGAEKTDGPGGCPKTPRRGKNREEAVAAIRQTYMPVLTLRSEALQPHFQLAYMFRYQFKGPLWGVVGGSGMDTKPGRPPTEPREERGLGVKGTVLHPTPSLGTVWI